MKLPVATVGLWPHAGAPSIDFTAALLTVNLYLQRLLWSRQIEQSNDRTQSVADTRRVMFAR